MTQPRHNLLGIHGHQLRQVHRVRTLHKLRLGFLAILIVLITGGGFAVLRKHSEAKDLAAQTKKKFSTLCEHCLSPSKWGRSQHCIACYFNGPN